MFDDVKDQEQEAEATEVAAEEAPGDAAAESSGDAGAEGAAEEAIGEKLDEGSGAAEAAPGGSPETAESGETGEEAAAGEKAEGGEGEAVAEASEGDGPSVRRAEFESLTPHPGAPSGDNIDLLLDVTVPVTVELGSTEMLVKEILAVGPGSVVKLDRPLGKPLDILVNGELVGRGEVVVVDEQFGVRVTELAKPEAKK